MLHYGIRIDNYYQGIHFLRNDTPDETLLRYFYAGAEVRRQTLNYKQFATQGSFILTKSTHLAVPPLNANPVVANICGTTYTDTTSNTSPSYPNMLVWE